MAAAFEPLQARRSRHRAAPDIPVPNTAGRPGAYTGSYVRIPTKPAMHSNSKPAGYSDLKPATRGVVRMGQIHDVVEGWEGQETGWS